MRALEKVAEGVELTVSYVDFLNLSAERQRILKKQYHFNCTCKHCSEHIKDDLMMAAKEGDGSKVRERYGCLFFTGRQCMSKECNRWQTIAAGSYCQMFRWG